MDYFFFSIDSSHTSHCITPLCLVRQDYTHFFISPSSTFYVLPLDLNSFSLTIDIDLLHPADLGLTSRNKYQHAKRFGCYQVSFLNRSRAEGRRGILRSTTSRGAGTTSLAGRFALLSMTGRAVWEYTGGSDAERTGGRRNRCLSLRPVGGAGADTGRASVPAGSLQSDDGRNEGNGGTGGTGIASAGCCWCWWAPASALAFKFVPVPIVIAALMYDT